ncbi:hypothetical protein TW95_gp1701 [Pandoravirus inopinatum]|uniref:Uncharacterized protein n=1 Tax=Pandoravirus inopinatum TaxID=1605721 RepID=A0A0B5J8Z3_9VIRU|nr:hypothetical protein TW95_gp1701 [Pandoravirus inopinatum]AJF98435.1 hypothetical protein [Pandoravirus inopinatum]
MEEPGWPSRRRPRAETPTEPDVGEPPRRRPRIGYQQRFGLVLGRPGPAPNIIEASEAMQPLAPPTTVPPTPTQAAADPWSLIEALPPEVLVELLERMLVVGRETQAIRLCGSNRNLQRLCQETTINARALGLPLVANRYSIINAARALAFGIAARRCILWAWLLAAQRIIDNAQRGTYAPALREGVGRRLGELAKHVNLDRVPYNDLLLWATSRSPDTMPRKAQYIFGSDLPYLWQQLIVRAYGVPAGPTPYGMAPLLYADPSDPHSTLVALDSSPNPLPSHATLLDEVETSDAIRAGWIPPDFVRLPLDQRQALVQTPEYAKRVRERIVDALDQALRDAERARSAAQPGQAPDSARLTEPGCARRLFDLFDVRVFVAPGRLRLSHYAAIRLRPADVWPFDPVNYWTL